MVQQLLFILVLAATAYFAWRKYSEIIRNIRLGKSENISGNTGRRWKNVLLVAFGQKKMFKRWIPALLHLFIYLAFLITQVELIEIIADGLSGSHRMFALSLGGFYTFVINVIEILSVLALIGTVIFLIRRNALTIPRFDKAEMTSWPKLDANLILIGEVLLIFGIFSMNGADVLLQQLDTVHYPDTGPLIVSSWLGPVLFEGLDMETLAMIERIGWWLHVLVVFGFICYLPYSKHLHIFFAFPNTYFQKVKPFGKMDNMPDVMREVRSMLGLSEGEDEMNLNEEVPEFGAKDIFDLSWKSLLDAYSCTECGRCTDVCPANRTGKKLSPRKIVMDIRDRSAEVGRKLDSGKEEYILEGEREQASTLTPDNFDDGKSLFDYISREELHACTTCNACVEACPVLINPLEPILQMRRYEILTEAAGPQDWMPMFTSLENSGNVWQMPDERDQWVADFEEE